MNKIIIIILFYRLDYDANTNFMKRNELLLVERLLFVF